MQPRCLILFLLLPFLHRPQSQPGAPLITAPQSGQVVQGQVAIRGTSAMAGFAASELTFTYADGTLPTWFLLAVNQQPVQNDVLALWNTTAITDGNYTLRLRVYLTDGGYQDTFVDNVRVRNYTPVETSTPLPSPTATVTPVPATPPQPTATATPLPPTPSPLPPNPAALRRETIQASAVYGAALTLLLFALFGAGMYLRRAR